MSLHLLISYSYYYFVVFLFSRSTPKYIRYYTTSFSSAEVTKNLPGITPHVFLFSEIKDKPATIIMFLFIRDTKKYAMHATCPSFSSGTQKYIRYIITCLLQPVFLYFSCSGIPKKTPSMFGIVEYETDILQTVWNICFLNHANSMTACYAHCMNGLLRTVLCTQLYRNKYLVLFQQGVEAQIQLLL